MSYLHLGDTGVESVDTLRISKLAAIRLTTTGLHVLLSCMSLTACCQTTAVELATRACPTLFTLATACLCVSVSVCVCVPLLSTPDGALPARQDACIHTHMCVCVCVCVYIHAMLSTPDVLPSVSLLLQVTGYLVFINIITGAGAIIPAMLIAPTTARHEAKKLLYHTTQVSSKCGLSQAA